ncbi:hypothetical protein AAHA92_33946 [Salvia divinorum]|uniref:Uncharacterized protein n=1 Tax=Salvia divinorum TaxID=28513 RepID=A0ABD1FHC6_SALDI
MPPTLHTEDAVKEKKVEATVEFPEKETKGGGNMLEPASDLKDTKELQQGHKGNELPQKDGTTLNIKELILLRYRRLHPRSAPISLPSFSLFLTAAAPLSTPSPVIPVVVLAIVAAGSGCHQGRRLSFVSFGGRIYRRSRCGRHGKNVTLVTEEANADF